MTRAMKSWGLVALASVAVATVAVAGVNVATVTQKHTRNATSISVQAYVTGDDDSNAVCRIFQRKDGVAAFDTGMVMVRRPGTRTHSGRILWLTPNDTADFYIEAVDGATIRSAVDTATIARVREHPSGGTNYYVNKATGSDTYDGASATFVSGTIGPKLTIQSAVSKLVSDNAASGSTVNVAIGEYHEAVTLSSGTNGRFFRLLGASRDSTIICAANPNVEVGRYDNSNAIAWTYRPDSPTTVDSVYKCYFPSAGGPADSTQLVVLGFGEQLQRKTSLAAMFADSMSHAGSGLQPLGEASGWFWLNDTLYVKSATGAVPSVTGNHFGYRDQPLYISARNWTVSTLTVRYGGAIRPDNTSTEATFKANALLTAGTPDLSLSGHAILLGTSGDAASYTAGTVINNCRFYGFNAAQVYGPNYGAAYTGVRADSVTVANCIFDGLTIGAMNYAAGKARSEEDVAATDIRGKNISVYNNYILGTFNGITSGTFLETDSTYGADCEYSYNTIRGLSDDSIELDVSCDINILVLRNTVRESSSGLSVVPAYRGPVFAFFNVFACTNRGAKLGGGNTAPVYWYHNTFYPDPTRTSTPFLAVEAVGGATQHNYFANNDFFSAPVATGTVSVLMPAVADSARIRTNEFNWNNYYCGSDSANNINTWAATTRTLATTKSGLSLEANGRASAGSTAAFESAASYNFRLTSAATREPSRGRRLTGINAAWGATRYALHPAWSTNAPDLGAYEFGYPVEEYIRRKSWTKRYIDRH